MILDQIADSAEKLGLGEHVLNSHDTGLIFEEHPNSDIIAFMEGAHRFSIQYLFSGCVVDSIERKKPLSSLLLIELN